MLDLKLKIAFGIACGLLLITYMLFIFAYCLLSKSVKEVKCANRGDVESCIESENTQEKIIGAKPITYDELCALQYCEECSMYTNSDTPPPCFCGIDNGP